MANLIESFKKQASQNTIYHALYGFFFRGSTIKDVADIYHKDRTTIARCIKTYEEKGEVTRKRCILGMYRKFDVDQRTWIINLFRDRPILHQNEAASLFFQKF